MSKNLAVPLAPSVFRIPTAGRALINTFAFVDDEGVTLVDCGVAKAPPRIVAGLAAMGKDPADVTRIVLTHVHPDHAGGAAETQRRTGASVLVHERDVHFAETATTPVPVRPTLTGRIFRRLTASVTWEPVEVTAPLADGDTLPVAGGLRVLHTPGHTPGHVSLLHEPTGLLITGDAIWNLGGLRRAPALGCWDVRMTERTAHVLGDLDYEIVAFTHGEEIRQRAREQVRRLLARLESPAGPDA